MKILTKNLTLALGIGMAIFACSETKDKTEEVDQLEMEQTQPKTNMEDKTITTQIMSKSGSDLAGMVTFKEVADGSLDVTVALRGIAPGEHAVHLHETGDCSAPDGKSAGGHWNPLGVEHGHRLEDEEFHKGDIGNITIGEDSTGTFNMQVEGWSIEGDSTTNILNKAVIVHAGPDDFTSQPSGAAGPRIGCGVIAK
ncbi:superoxide dismutase [Roseivirga spongicola]|uniref:Superoxide dismutase n=1 Tax=Roseivirga spongicola TaxID=333140 RepID=A0A150X5K6_9BACT|nr:superoxide dismutase family protein [Roseivirga spongicola]KYG73976.1 superoxide dismutase [Roseivirga spongicola]